MLGRCIDCGRDEDLEPDNTCMRCSIAFEEELAVSWRMDLLAAARGEGIAAEDPQEAPR